MHPESIPEPIEKITVGRLNPCGNDLAKEKGEEHFQNPNMDLAEAARILGYTVEELTLKVRQKIDLANLGIDFIGTPTLSGRINGLGEKKTFSWNIEKADKLNNIYRDSPRWMSYAHKTGLVSSGFDNGGKIFALKKIPTQPEEATA